MSLSKEYSISLSFPVKYINLPKDKLIVNQLPEMIDVEIRSTGFNLLIYKLKQQKETVVLDIKDAKATSIKNNFYINCNDRLDKVTSQFNSAIKVVHIVPDTVFINYNKKITKRVPVKASIILDFEEQYHQTDSVLLEPSFVEISGSSNVLGAINFVQTIPVSVHKLNKSMVLDLKLFKDSSMKKIEFSQNTVKAKINVTKFTESVLELPVEVVNLPAGLNMKTFPDKITIKYQVAFDEYGKVNASDFRVAVDYTKIEPGNNKLKVFLVKSPANVRSVRLSNEKVEYIIRK